MPQRDFDPYAVLGVARRASADEIKAAYRELVAKYHPDHHHGNPLEDLAADKLTEINRAYEILSDPERRSAYDAGQPAGPRPVRSPFDRISFGGKRRHGTRWLYLIGLLLLIPLLIRIVIFLARVVARTVRLGAEGLSGARGTPLLLVLVTVAIVGSVFLFLRRRKR